MQSMIEIDDKIISTEILTEEFCCPLDECKGECCVDGNAGAPLEIEEVDILEEEWENYKPYMTPEGIAVIEREGFTNLADALRAKATSLLIEPSGDVYIRGINSIGNPAPALIICDGMEVGTINAININDVASVEIQRDGTLYGFKGVGGVISIKTKSGAKR